jgi:protein TonB
MRWWAAAGYSLSIAVHFGLAAGVGSIRKDHPRRPTTVKVFETKKEKKKEPEPEKKENKPPPPPKKVEAPPPPKNTPPPPTNATPTPAGHEAMAALPDFGIALSGGGEGGIAVPVAGLTANAAAGPRAAGGPAPTEKKVKGPAPKPTDATDACVEEATKPKPTDKTAPQYIGSAAQSAGVEGLLAIEFTVDATGEVVDVKVVSGSNPKLDELALPAAKRWKFAPATKCGKPVPSKYITRMRFTLGE